MTASYGNFTENLSSSQDSQASDIVHCPLARKNYRYWRLRIMYSIMLGYATYYLVRMNFSMAMPAIEAELGYTKTQLGWILSVHSIIYGIGKFVNGYISDRSNARYFMTCGLFGSALISVFMGLGSGLIIFTALWSVNAWLQSMGWPPVVRLLTHWFSPRELGTKWGFWAASHGIGGAAIMILGGYLIEYYGWRYAFFIPGALAFCIAVFLLNRLRDTPESIGLPPVERYKKEAIDELSLAQDEKLTHWEQIKLVLGNPLIWYVGMGNLCVYIVRMGVFTWAPTFLKEMKGYTPLSSGWQVASFEIAGISGGFLAGWISDKVFHGRRGPVSVLYMIALGFSLFYFLQSSLGSPMLDTLVMIAVGYLVYGPQVLAGVAAADFASKKAAGTATGLIGTFAYAGAALSGVGTGLIVDMCGWSGGFVFFITAAFLGAGFFALTWHHRASVLKQEV